MQAQLKTAQANTRPKFLIELAKPAQEKNFKIFLPHFKSKKLKHANTRAVKKEKENETNDKFNMKVQFYLNTQTDKNRQCITTAIPNKGFSGFRALTFASNFVSVDSDVLRNPLLGIAATVSGHAMTTVQT